MFAVGEALENENGGSMIAIAIARYPVDGLISLECRDRVQP